MRTIALPFILLILALASNAQIAPDKYFVSFTDKNNSPYSIDNPSQYLSQRAIERRLNQGIAIEESDLPVNPDYLAGVAATGATILNPTKWLNGVTVYTTDPAVLAAINELPYVQGVTRSSVIYPSDNKTITLDEKPFFKHENYNAANSYNEKQGNEIGIFDYGYGLNQIQMLNGDELHQLGFTGQGKVIAVLDAGFLNANTHPAFDSLWANDQILGTRDFVRGGEVLFDEHPHGAMVLSCMGSNYPGQLIGTAPKAKYWLLRSEDGGSEYIIEEYNWVSAAEYADSVGADVINSSLGYSEFNDASQNHTYADMNGNTTPCTRGADMAARKGILVVNSLGNEGSSAWYYLSAPSDGDSVLGIGAVDGSGNYASFSSHGPSYDGRVKPDVAAQGSGVCIADPFAGGFSFGGGTSFSSPILAGMATCLWQANPSMNNMQIADAIRQSASQYSDPDEMLGFGIPDFIQANNILTLIDDFEGIAFNLSVYPNPFNDHFLIDAWKYDSIEAPGEDMVIEILDLTGRTIGIQKYDLSFQKAIKIDLLKESPAGIYFVKVNIGENQAVVKVTKN